MERLSLGIFLILSMMLSEGILDMVFAADYAMPHNMTSSAIHTRQKRHLPLMFPEGGILKLLLGFAMPINNPMMINLIFALNFQYQYPVPPNISFFTQYYPFVDVVRSKRSAERGDSERLFFYEAVERSMDGIGVNGKECLLRTICEAAEAPVDHNGVVGEIFHLLLTPPYKDLEGRNGTSSSDLEDEYCAARRAGDQLYDCRDLYPKCPRGYGLFDFISYLV